MRIPAFLTITLLLVSMRSAEAQVGSGPFDALHASLIRAAAEEVQQIRSDQALTETPSVRTATDSIRTQSAPPDHITKPALRRLHSLEPVIGKIFSEEGVPRELLLVGLVESGYQTDAVSRAQAVGMWQFIPETARRFGLINEEGDFRTDILRSTRAAAQYLRALLDQFQDWRLALAAYNAGEERVEEAIQKARSRDFSALSRLGLLPRETLNYVPAVLSAIAEARNHGLLDR